MSSTPSANKEASTTTKKNIAPALLAAIAAGALQNREPKRQELWAMGKMNSIARKDFRFEPIPESKSNVLDKVYSQTTYWHGTGRYHRQGGEKVDVIAAILKSGNIDPSPDSLKPTIKVTSLSTSRLYARAYADMHSDQSVKLNRFVSTPNALAFYMIRPGMRYMRGLLNEARNHPDGFRAGVEQLRDLSRSRRDTPHSWQTKITSNPSGWRTAILHGIGSDIPGNFPILFGIDKGNTWPIKEYDEFREIQVDEPITLDQLTHVEVPREKVGEVSQLFTEHNLHTPVIAIEDMEQYIAQQAIGEVLLGRHNL